MYDKIELLVPVVDRDHSISIEEAVGNIDYDYHFMSRINNCVRQDYMNGYSKIRGSLAKFYYGENMSILSFGEVRKALDKLGKAFTVKLHNAKVLLLEFGSNFMVKHPACEYLKLFGDCRYFKRMDIYNPTGKFEAVTYFTRKREHKFIAYDKVAEMYKNRKEPSSFELIKFIAFNENIEMKDKRRRIPDLYKETNVLRLEYTVKKRGIQAIFGRDLTAYDLAEPEVYRILQERFCRFYKSISKTGRIIFINPACMIKKTSRLFKDLALEQLRQLEPNEYNYLLQDTQAQSLLPDYTFPRIRAKNRLNSTDYNISYTNVLIAELDALIKLKMGKIV
jgi:hypothetical protein